MLADWLRAGLPWSIVIIADQNMQFQIPMSITKDQYQSMSKKKKKKKKGRKNILVQYMYMNSVHENFTIELHGYLMIWGKWWVLRKPLVDYNLDI